MRALEAKISAASTEELIATVQDYVGELGLGKNEEANDH